VAKSTGQEGRVRLLLVADAEADVPRLTDVDVRRIAEGGIDDADTRDCDTAVAALDEPLPALRRLHALDPALQLVAIVPAAARDRVRRALLFTPGLGEVWILGERDLDQGLLERAAAITAARRDYRSVRQRTSSELTALEPHPARRAVVSDAFLAALLRGSPDPVISLDADSRVLTWNVAAERVLAVPRLEAIGRPFADLVELAEEGTTHDRGDGANTRLVRYPRADGTSGFATLISMPVEVEGHHINAIVLHDETDLRRSQAELEQQAVELEQQAVELEMVNEALQRQGDELREALTSRSRFYAAMSHELRTPINAIIGYNALLLEGVYGELPPAQRDALLRGQRAANHLLELVNDVLDLAKIEAGRLDVRPEVVPVAELLAELLDTVAALADEYGAPLTLDGPDTPCKVITDPRRVRQILFNLLSNAVKYGSGRPVTVSWSPRRDGGVDIAICDRGPGIAPEDRERIFHEFEQVRDNGQPASAPEGTGLGLSISVRLATLLGGEILLDSEPGRGSTFTLRLPARLHGAG
jgi:PAS domain S-box-containing protein